MRGAFFLLASLVLLILGGIFFLTQRNAAPPTQNPTAQTNQPATTLSPTAIVNDSPKFEVIAKNLDIPWSLDFLPTGEIIFTERAGKVRLLDKQGIINDIATIAEVKHFGEGGLLGIKLHPEFETNRYVYIYYTYAGNGNNTLNRVERFKLENNSRSEKKTIVDQIPGAIFHNGGRLKFGPDKYLYITTGDATEPSLAQNTNSLAGKILRVTDEGQPAPGNPFNNLAYSYGHRNPQGITWDGTQLWETEHGQSAQDELNFIEYGKNYGWPTIRGDQTQVGMEKPVIQSGSDTWAPSGTAFFKGSIYFAGLKGQALYQAVIKNDNKVDLKTHFKGQFGRIRDVVLGPDQMLYILTSNRDRRGSPINEDDRIIRINPSKL